MELQEYKLEDFIEENFEVVDINERIFKVIGIFKTKKDIKAVLVYENGKYRGIVTEELLIRLKFDPQEKVDKVMKTLSPLKKENSIVLAAKRMLENGIRAIPVEINHEIKIVTAGKILSVLKDTEFGDLLVADLMTEDVIAITPNTKISKAIMIMRKKNISRLPVVEDGKVIGMLTIRDIVEKVIYPRERSKFGDLAGETYTPLSSPVSAIMTTNVYYVKKNDKIRKFIELIERYDISGSPVVDEEYRLVGIITIRDLLEEIAKEKKEEVELIITTAGFPLDEIDKEWLRKVIERKIIRRYKKVIGEYAHFFIHIKKIRETVERSNIMRFFNVRIRLHCGRGRFYVSDEGWDIYNAIRNALEALEDVLRREKGKIEERELYKELLEEIEIL